MPSALSNSSSWIVNGGATRSVEEPQVMIATPRFQERKITSAAFWEAGLRVCLSSTNLVQCLSSNLFLGHRQLFHFAPLVFQTVSSRKSLVCWVIKQVRLFYYAKGRVSTTHDTGFPPNVLACEPPVQSITIALAMVAPIGNPETKAFRCADDVWFNVPVFDGEPFEFSTQSRLNFVSDKQDAIFVCKFF